MTDQQNATISKSDAISAYVGYLTGVIQSSKFDKALDYATTNGISAEGISTAKNYVTGKMLIVSVLVGAFKDGPVGVSNVVFSAAVGALAGPAAGAAYGVFVDWLAQKSSEWEVGGKVYDFEEMLK